MADQRRQGADETLRSIDVIKHGVSPRIVRADIVGSKGRTSVTGPDLRTRLGLDDTWVQFVFNGATTKPTDDSDEPAPTTPGDGSGGATLSMGPSLGPALLSRVIARPPGYVAAHGRVWPDGGGHVVRLQVRNGHRWHTAMRVTADATGRWTALLPVGTKYRVAALGVAGPILNAR